MRSPIKNLPKSVKYLVCYLPFIVVGTVLIVVGIFEEDTARIASIIVGIVVLISGLFAWCTDTDVGCLLICRYSSSKQKQRQQELSTESGQDARTKTPTNTDSRGRSPDIEAAINHTTTFTITNNRTTIINNRVDSPVNNNYEDTKITDRLTGTHGMTNNSINRYGKYSLQQKASGRVRRQRFGDDTLVKESRVGAFALRNRDGDPVEGNSFGTFGNFGRGIRKNRKSRLTVTNVTALNSGMINRGYHNSSEGDLQNIPYDPAFNVEFFMDRVKHNAISNWVTNVTSSMEDLTQASVYPDPIPRSKQYRGSKLQQQQRQSSVETSISTRTDPNSLPPPDELEEDEETIDNSNSDTDQQQPQELGDETEVFHASKLNRENTVEEQTLGSDGEQEEYDIDEFMGKDFLLQFGFANVPE